MPPNNTNSRKSNEPVEASLSLEKIRPATCHPEEDISRVKSQANGISHSTWQTNVTEQQNCGPHRNRSICSLMDELLCDIYSKMEVRRTSATTCDLSWQDSDYSRCSRNEARCLPYWRSKDLNTLKIEKSRLEKLISEEGHKLVKQLKRKNSLLLKRETHYDVITAYIQAVSHKTREDTKMKFSLTPGAETGFSQWLDAMKMVAQLPGGMPSEFRTKLWLQLSEKHLNDQNVDWEKAEAVIFNEWTNPDDEELGVQIVKDLHRTGCSLFCGEQEHNQALLKRVLLAYARWNKNVGYCQGFNMLAALILQVMDKDEKNAVKVMIYLIEGVLPESYFANNLRGLSVDMAVFRDLLRLRLPKLSKHLEALQHDTNAGTSYEPPLTNVFTMQWFLTLFSNCLPQQTVLRVWDLVFLYGNEVLLRTAIAIWGILQDRVITVESADEFYSIMGVVTREMLEFGLMDANALVKTIAMVDPFPNELQELREKYFYNISPWTQSVHSAAKKGIRLFYSDPDDQDDTEDEDKIALATAYGVFRRRESTSKELQVSGPTLDISVLKQQYAKLRQRQRQAHVIITAACSSNLTGSLTAGPSVSVNHLLMGKSALINKGRRIGPPEGSIPPPNKKEEKEERRPKVVISGETFHWKDAEKRKLPSRKSKSNKEVMHENERNRVKAKGEEDRLKTNHDRMEGVSEESVENSLRRKSYSSGSSGSSTSTELCDEEFHRYTDSDDATPSDLGASPKSPRRVDFPQSPKLLGNAGCDKNNLKEIKTLAINLVNEIEEKIQTSGKLTRMRQEETQTGGRSPSPNSQFDNTKNLILDSHLQIIRDNILKPEPEVPTLENVIQNPGAEVKTPKDEGGGWGELEGGKNRRKSDLALSVIKENLEMLRKYSQKPGETSEPERKPEVQKTEDMMWFDDCKKDVGTGETGELLLRFQPEEETQKTVPQLRASKNFFVEKAISPIVEKPVKTDKVNKEVNTELTFGVDEVEISTKQSKFESNYKIDTTLQTEEATCRNLQIPRENGSVTPQKPLESFPETKQATSRIPQEPFLEKNQATSRIPQEPFLENKQATSRIPQEPFLEKNQATSRIPQEPFLENNQATSRITQEPFLENNQATSRIPQEPFLENKQATSRIPQESFPETKQATSRIPQEPFLEKNQATSRIPQEPFLENKQATSRIPQEPFLEKNQATSRIPQESFLENKQATSRITQEPFPETKQATSRIPQAPFLDNKQTTSRITQEPFLENEQATSRITQELFLENKQATSRIPQEPFLENKQATSRISQELFLENEQATSRIPFEPFLEYNSPTSHELFREKDEIKKRLESSKSDWELKMRKIAELETTTRETLNEIQARSNTRKSLHRSLDRNTRRTYLDEFKLKSPEKPFIPKIHLESSHSGDGEPNHRKLKISAKSFDEITSRTEKLLGKSEKFNRSTDETTYKRTLSPEFEPWKQKDSTPKYKNLLEENFPDEPENPGKSYGFSSSPTSPESRTRSNIRYLDHLTPKYSGEGKGKYEDDLMRITQNESKTSLELLERKYSPENRKPEIEFESHSSRGSFNPFPRRTVSRSKELGVKLGLYPTSPEAQSKKS